VLKAECEVETVDEPFDRAGGPVSLLRKKQGPPGKRPPRERKEKSQDIVTSRRQIGARGGKES
jgi:hypothetical protein